ncbi:hypothetical protein CEUSTIGMA_g1674.t1 [Chlamydomonas eustigma]|uniref:Magnesium transporter MgtE intracellular domain-containing protein n=1 Tax=Chlamydomonas eustigma TaxID=1157962 RepID=A0A250WTU5_9CHLO|nr:hypothetical protein CEUSTIGMA_g1674.t1 [Chlamydomonas eustigma]|eukprot:GAX74225.1 hypothetical protein CEUSTIGMA_g1674.t1 [Chlamydomonas eustigma]
MSDNLYLLMPYTNDKRHDELALMPLARNDSKERKEKSVSKGDDPAAQKQGMQASHPQHPYYTGSVMSTSNRGLPMPQPKRLNPVATSHIELDLPAQLPRLDRVSSSNVQSWSLAPEEKHNSPSKPLVTNISMDVRQERNSTKGRVTHVSDEAHGPSLSGVPITTKQVSGGGGTNSQVLPPVSSMAANGQQAVTHVGFLARKGGMELNGNSKAVFESFVAHTFDPEGTAGVSGFDVGASSTNRGIGRKTLLVRIPAVFEGLAAEVPGQTLDQAGNACMIVLPSDKPSTRAEALAVENLLIDLWKVPDQSSHQAAIWRGHTLSTLCSDALSAIGEVLRSDRLGQRPLSLSWYYRLMSRDGGKMGGLSAGMHRSADGKGGSYAEADQQLATEAGGPQAPSHLNLGKGVPDLSHLSMRAANLCLSSAMLMADLVRQVEVQCGERGRVLSYVWNACMASHEMMVQELKRDVARLSLKNQELSEQTVSLRQLSTEVDFLRREAGRFRAAANKSSREADKLIVENLVVTGQLDEALSTSHHLTDFLTRQLVRLRWKHAFHLIGSRVKVLLVSSGGLPTGNSPIAVLAKARMVVRLQAAVIAAERRKRLFGLRRSKEEYTQPTTFTEVVKTSLAIPQHEVWLGSANNVEEVKARISKLQPEVQVMVLNLVPTDIRWKVFESMDSLRRAQMAALMSQEMCEEARHALGADAWSTAISTIRDTPELASRYLSSMDVREAMLEMSRWSDDQRVTVYHQMDSQGYHEQAARILRQLPTEQRKTVVLKANTKSIARIIQSLNVERMVDCLEGLHDLREAQILEQVAPEKTAALLQTLNPQVAAKKLMFMDNQEARYKAVAQLAPKFGATVVVCMDEEAKEILVEKKALQESMAILHPDLCPESSMDLSAAMKPIEPTAAALSTAHSSSSEQLGAAANSVLSTNGAEAEEDRASVHEGTATLLAMDTAASENILAHLAFSQKADILARVDPSRVNEILKLMESSEALLLLSSMSEVSQKVVTEEMSAEERLRLMQVLKTADADAEDAGKKKKKGKKSKDKRGTITFQAETKAGFAEALELAADRALVEEEDEEGDEVSPDLQPIQEEEPPEQPVKLSSPSMRYAGSTLRRNAPVGLPSSSSARYVPGNDTPKGSKAAVGGGQFSKKLLNSKTTTSGHLGRITDSGEGTLSGTRSKRFEGDLVEEVIWREYRASDSGSQQEGEDKDQQVAPTLSSKATKGPGPSAKGSKVTKSDEASRHAARGAMKIAIMSTPEGANEVKVAKERLAAVDHAWDMSLSADGLSGGDGNGKLGKLPKNQRLKDAMSQHRNARPKPKGWLLSVVEQVYKDGENLVKKLGRAEVIRKQSIPEIVFAYFFNKYGQKSVVNENVGSMVNTLTAFKAQDLRLEIFARFLSEEWDFPTFLDFLSALSAAIMPSSRTPAIEWPTKDGDKPGPTGEQQYAYLDTYKAISIADGILGHRVQAARKKFNEFIKNASVPVDDPEAEKTVRRDQRFAGEVMPERFYRLPRVTFLILLCKEMTRINTAIAKIAETKFLKLDVQRLGQMPVTELPSYLASLLPPGSSLQDVQRQFIAFAESHDKDVPASEVQVENVEKVGKESFIEATVHSMPIREYFKMTQLVPPRPDDDMTEADSNKRVFGGIVRRHAGLLMPRLHQWLREDGSDAALSQLLIALSKAAGGDAKFKAYLNLLTGIIGVKVQALVEASGSEKGIKDFSSIEHGLCKLEDMVVLMLQNTPYLMAREPSAVLDAIKRLPPNSRIHQVASDIKVFKQVRTQPLLLQHPLTCLLCWMGWSKKVTASQVVREKQFLLLISRCIILQVLGD